MKFKHNLVVLVDIILVLHVLEHNSTPTEMVRQISNNVFQQFDCEALEDCMSTVPDSLQ